MKILGISDDYMGNVTLFDDGQPVFAAANERFSRKKGDAGFPTLALEALQQATGLGLDDMDRIVVANHTHFVYRMLRENFKDYKHDFFNVKQKVYLKYHDMMGASRVMRTGVRALNRQLVQRRLGHKVRMVDHHTAHAWSAVATSGFDSALSVTLDNLGDGYSAKVHSWRDGKLTFLYGASASNSPGQFYGEITQLLGFNPLRHAGKVTGLSARGDAEPAYPIMESVFRLSRDQQDFRMMPSPLRWQTRGPYWKLGLYSMEDVAAAAQKRLEDVVAAYVRHAMQQTGHTNLVLAGGVAANVKLNLVLHELPEVHAVHVHPAMSDAGLSFGAAVSALASEGRLRPQRMETACLGPGYPDQDADDALQAADLGYRNPPDAPTVVARLLDKGHVIARFGGRLEYGPRALGNRSILYRPDDPSVMDWLNEKLRRTEFMPFAPVTLWEDAEDCYYDVEGVKDTSRFMTMALRCKPIMAERCAGVVHVDGTARPQLVVRDENPEYYDIVAEYKRISGRPCIINTSFNMHEEPIVCTPPDAVAAFQAADLDFLLIHGRIAWNPRHPELMERLDNACAGNQ